MNAREVFETWAPPHSPWSDWAKAPLFVNLPTTAPRTLEPQVDLLDLSNVPKGAGDVALVVNLNGALSALFGLAAARRGYRPVPLYNCSGNSNEVVPTGPLRDALDHGANDLARLAFPANAPPAFLLDANRLVGGQYVEPGRFDNRWVVFAQDFPSANYLREQGVGRILVVQPPDGSIAEDLVHVLLRWQLGGLEIHMLGFDPLRPSRPACRIVVRRPPYFQFLLRRALVILGLRRSSAGGFGAAVPQQNTDYGGGRFG